MRREEAKVVYEYAAAAVGPSDEVVCVNLGSSSSDAIEKAPHVAALYADLKELGVRVINTDLKAAPNVDIVGDLFSKEVQDQIAALRPRLVLLCNVLEHVRNPVALCDVVTRITPVGGHVICTVPHSYPYHADPIDTLFRPDVAGVAALFPALRLVSGAPVQCGGFFSNRGSRSRRRYVAQYALRLLFPFVRPAAWGWHVHNLMWIHRKYIVTCVLLRREP